MSVSVSVCLCVCVYLVGEEAIEGVRRNVKTICEDGSQKIVGAGYSADSPRLCYMYVEKSFF